MEKITEIYIIHYIDAYEIDVCATLAAAERIGRDYLEEIAVHFSETENAEILKEFEDSISEYDGVFFVEDVMWVEVQPLYY